MRSCISLIVKADNDMVNEGRTRLSSDALAVMGISGAILMLYHLAAMQPGQPHGLMALISLGLLFAIVGVLYQGWLKQVVKARHYDFVAAAEAGISLAQKDGLPAQFRAWDSVAEVILARQFKIIYPEGQIACRHAVVIFLKPDHKDEENVLLPTPSGVSESGTGRRYLSADFPDGDWRKFESALYEFAPTGVKVRVSPKAVFDRKAGVDRY